MREVIKANKWLLGVVTAVTISTVSLWEGRVYTPYYDVVGVKTVCDGHTGADIEDREYTDAECDALLAKDLVQHADKVLACVQVPINVNQHAALTSWAYNVGTGAACKSSAMRRLNAGDYNGFCDGLLAWDKAGGKTYRGLTRRRHAERELCLRPVA